MTVSTDRRRALAALVAIVMVVSMVTLYTGTPAFADHIDETGQVGSNCVEFQSGNTGTESPPDFPDVNITLDSWQNTPGDPHTVNFSVSGLTTDQYVDISVKSGQDVQEHGPYGNGDHSVDNGIQNGISHVRICVFEDDPDTDPEDPTIELDLTCRMDASDGPTTNVSFTVDDPDGVVESITVDGPGSFTEQLDSSNGWSIDLLPGDYTWSADFDATYSGDPLGGDVTIGPDCLSCPIPGAIDLSNSGQLGSFDSPFFDTWGGPVQGVNIPAGLYNITLASYDNHSEKAGQMQTQEIWALANGPNGGTWQSPLTPDLAENVNFAIYTNVGGGPVQVPDIQDLYTVHGAIGAGEANSVYPVCAQFEPVTQEVDVDVVANSCQVNDQGQPVGSIDISMDPDSQATVRIYDDPAKTADDLVAEVSSTDSIGDLAPGTYYWEAEAAAGFELTGPSEGEVTIEDCQSTVNVVSNGVCEVAGNSALGSVEITVDPSSSAEVTVYSDAAMTQEVLSTSDGGEFDLAPGTYFWNAEAADGFELTGETSGQFTIDPCDTSVTVGGSCVVEDGLGVGVIDVTISTPGSVSVEITDSNNDVVATLTESGTATVPEGASYSWSATAADGFDISGATSGEVQIEECTPPPPPEEDEGEIIVEKVVVGDGSQTFEFTFDADGFTLGDDTLAHGQSSSSGALTPGDGYSVAEVVPNGWTQVSAVCDDGSDPSNIDVEAGEQVTCTFTNQIEDEVLAAIQVTVEGSCEVDDDEGEGLIEVTIAVADGATVVVEDSDGDVVGTLTSDGTITVPEGATYTWEATPNEGFEFPAGFDSSGSIVIETCSDPDELPFTGMNMDVMAALGAALLGTGIAVVTTLRKREEDI